MVAHRTETLKNSTIILNVADGNVSVNSRPGSPQQTTEETTSNAAQPAQTAVAQAAQAALAAQVAHSNEDLEYIQEESACLISGTPDGEVWA